MMPSSDVQRQSLLDRIYGINESGFRTVALDVCQYQLSHNPLYRKFAETLGKLPSQVREIEDIPFLPISMFRDHDVQSGTWPPEVTFRSSGTTTSVSSRHLIRDIDWYHRITTLCFTKHFDAVENYTWIGLLPSYLERTDSSLVQMVQHFMELSGRADNNFFLKPERTLIKHLLNLYKKRTPTILIGVAFALLDLFEKHEVPVWDNLLVIETGGMKGRGEEITREELHERLRNNHPGLKIASEYGMTEMMSQAYMKNEKFYPGPTMRICIRDISDPLRVVDHGQRGAINVIDLANLDTCSFIATDDIGVVYVDGSFDVLGRLDQSEMRGCNLMYS